MYIHQYPMYIKHDTFGENAEEVTKTYKKTQSQPPEEEQRGVLLSHSMLPSIAGHMT